MYDEISKMSESQFINYTVVLMMAVNGWMYGAVAVTTGAQNVESRISSLTKA